MAFWIIFLVISVVSYGLLIAWILPGNLLKTEFAYSTPTDRGIKNVKETTGRSIVFRPAIKFRNYVRQYVLSDRNGKKIFMAKVADGINYLDYDLVMFDGARRVFKVLNVKEKINGNFTEIKEIPSEVAFVTLVINQANQKTFEVKSLEPVSGGKIFSYVMLSALCTLVETFIVMICSSFIFGGVFRESFLISSESLWITLGFAGVAVIINFIFILSVVLHNNGKKNVKVRRKGER